jgi:hypothetical protein|tara:strand:+ start:96 stop:329 length:234 start_codon:yes stop_codon:yes gene_type:complete
MKAVILRELFWLVISTVLSLLLSFVFLELLELTSSERSLKPIEKVFSVQLYLIGCFLSFIAIYIVRVIISAVKMFTQ